MISQNNHFYTILDKKKVTQRFAIPLQPQRTSVFQVSKLIDEIMHHGLIKSIFEYILDTNQIHFSYDLVAKNGNGGVGYTADSGDIEVYPCCGYGNHLSDIRYERHLKGLATLRLNLTYI